MPVDSFGHENQTIKSVGLETSQAHQGESPKPLSQAALRHPQLEFWLELGSLSAHLLSISLVAFSKFHIRKKKIPLKNTTAERWGRANKGPVAVGNPVGGRGLGSLRLQASFCSSSPFLVGEAAGGGALPGCVGMAEKSILLKWFGSSNFTDCGSNTGIFSGTLGESFPIQFSYNGNGSSIPDFGDSQANQSKEYVCHPCPKVPG